MVFQIYGNILSSRIMTDKEAKKSKGYGFISYDNRTSAMQAMQNMNGYQANSSSKLINIREETESVDQEGRR
jgi:RNA recognition motif-containing protein